MTTYTKEYSDNSHVWMTPVADYAPMMLAHGCTFADFEAKHPNLAKSEYGQDLKATLEHLSNREPLVVVNEEFVPEDTTNELTEATLNELGQAYEEGADYILAAHVATVWGLKTEDAKAAAVIGRVICNHREWRTDAEVHKALKMAVNTIREIVY